MRYLGTWVVVLLTMSLWGYQPPENGLFYAQVAVQPAYLQQGPKRVFEHRSDGVVSVVQLINGVGEFNHYIVGASLQKPVLVKIFAADNEQARSMDSIFQDVADMFSDKMAFAAIDVSKQHNGARENYEILCQILVQEQSVRVQLPCFLLFYNGVLQDIPGVAQDGIVQGLTTKSQLETFLNSILLGVKGQRQVILGSTKPDLVATPTSQQQKSLGTTPAKDGKKSWWQRWWGYVNGKNK